MLKLTPSAVIVYQSVIYDDFIFIDGNRPLNQVKIKKIIAEIENGNDMLENYPIQVKVKQDKIQVLDGQHRYFISKKLNRPVYFIIVKENKSIKDIAKINSNVEKWKSANFVNCYIVAGNNNYQVVSNFLNTYKFSVGISLQLLSNGKPGSITGAIEKNISDAFESGEFEVKQEQAAINFAEKAKLFQSFPNWRSRNFLTALNRILEADKNPFDDLVEAFLKYPSHLQEQANYKGYIVNLETIINIGKKNRIYLL